MKNKPLLTVFNIKNLMNIKKYHDVDKSCVKTSLYGSKWLSICMECHKQEDTCCKNIEITLFPDEIHLFQERDPSNVFHLSDGSVLYEKESCCFLSQNNLCELQLKGILKPLDCLIYPLNYKNGSIFLDRSCQAKKLLDTVNAKNKLYEKISKFPSYISVEYEIQQSDQFIEKIDINETSLNKK
ncbi:MAG: hypothetical protein ACXAC7_07805 [Candidatus Hodarchaeales archaeon]|jgi:hypothetical protein